MLDALVFIFNNFILNLIIFALILSLIVVVHEFGHFIFAKIFNVYVEEFAIGFGPKLFSFKGKETEYRFNAILLGGYVKMRGEGSDIEEEINDPRGFEKQHAIKKLIIIYAGVFMNFVLASFIYTIFILNTSFVQYLPEIVPNTFPFGTTTEKVNFFVDPQDETSPLAKFKLTDSYVLEKINDVEINDVPQAIDIINNNKGKDIKLDFINIKDNTERVINVTPRVDYPKGKGSLGIGLSKILKLEFNSYEKPFAGILYSADVLQYNLKVLFVLPKIAIEKKNASILTNSLTGVVGIFEITSIVSQTLEIKDLFNLIAMLSLAVGLMNALPIPMLDGGVGVFVIIESLLKRKINPKVKNIINNVSLLILLMLFALVTYNDIVNFNIFNQIKDFWGNIFGLVKK